MHFSLHFVKLFLGCFWVVVFGLFWGLSGRPDVPNAGLWASLALLVHWGSLRPDLMTAVQREVQQGRDHDDKAGNQRNWYDPDPVGDKHGDSSMQKAAPPWVRFQLGVLLNFAVWQAHSALRCAPFLGAM